uniref:Uncharacterized protein n=1 Tax=Ixodes ricinus TaxID=34613 RepID=A0A6B0US48_IXORI
MERRSKALTPVSTAAATRLQLWWGFQAAQVSLGFPFSSTVMHPVSVADSPAVARSQMSRLLSASDTSRLPSIGSQMTRGTSVPYLRHSSFVSFSRYGNDAEVSSGGDRFPADGTSGNFQMAACISHFPVFEISL